MQTGDGLLARLTTDGSTIALDAFAGLCAAARTHGNGIIEITSRGSIQVRGLSAASAPLFAADVASLGIEASDGIPVIAGPLSGLGDHERIDALALAAETRAALAATSLASRLSAKVSAVIDGSGTLHLDGVTADIRLRAVGPAHAHVALAGDADAATPLGVIALDHAAHCVVRLFETLAVTAPGARMRDSIKGDGLAAFSAAMADLVIDFPEPARRQAADPIGIRRLSPVSYALGVGLPFGHSDSQTLLHLAAAAREAGASGVRTAPGRTLLFVELPPAAVRPLAAECAKLGFIVDPADPRRRVVACAGAPICRSGEIAARAMAPGLSDAASELSGGEVVHVSGCAKGCAHPGMAAVAVFGRDGCCDVFVDGALSCSVSAGALPERIVQIVRSRGALR
jgi:precorrin-3B synthase